ncbi:MAG: transporter substrate-binding domain-containing protein [Alphaproteobacteria bacterium]|nr:transporter substrate-binding domain-containing protein [Alphaproteobacteria bacterium]
MKTGRVIPAILLSALLASGLTYSLGGMRHPTQESAKETAFDRVMRTRTLNCGYVVYEPMVTKDPNTGVIGGIFPDVIESIAKRMDLKVNWAEEVNWTTYMQGLKTNRYDIICTPVWGMPFEAAELEIIGPILYSPIGVWVRTDDHRFDEDVTRANAPDITIAGVDGSYASDVARLDFTKAKLLSKPATAEYSDNLVDVITKKADITFVEVWFAKNFTANNPGKLRNVRQSKPFRVFPNYFGVGKGESKLQTTLQIVLNEMLNNGEIERIISKYEKYPNSFYRVLKPYVQPREEKS